MPRAVLRCHPGSACAAATGLVVGFAQPEPGVLALRYELAGDPSRLRVPAAAAPERRDGLWRHTCFELFAAAPGERYWEWNFSPSGEWAAYAFAGYREAMSPLELAAAPTIGVRIAAHVLTLEARTQLPETLVGNAREAVRLGLAAVVEDGAGELSYWALAHPRERPDFHAREAFTASLPPPDEHG
jgi:hypothetical protein